jgi:hypothetical protein
MESGARRGPPKGPDSSRRCVPMRRDLGGFARIEARCCNRPMRRTNPRTTVHGLLLACVLIAGACSKDDSPGTDGSAGAGGGGGRGGTGGTTGGAGGTTGGTGTGGTTGGTGGAGGAGGTTGGTGQDGPGSQFETGGVAGAPKLCGEIRNCVVRCTNAACAQACVDQAPAAARTKYQQVTTCSKAGCAENDVNCRCDRECLEPGACVPVVDECREGVEDDTFCDEQCH